MNWLDLLPWLLPMLLAVGAVLYALGVGDEPPPADRVGDEAGTE